MDRLVRVLVVDDSAYIRKVITEIFSKTTFIKVVGVARDGREALDLAEKLQPDVITLDLIMPDMDGVEFLMSQMARHPIPVVVVSIASEGGDLVLKALDAGAVDFVQKPTALAIEKIFEIRDELISKVKTAATVPMTKLPIMPPSSPVKVEHQPLMKRLEGVDIVLIGISTGGPQALTSLIPLLPADFPVPLAIVLHMPVGYTEMYARRLNEISLLNVVEARDGDLIQAGTVFVAPAGRHLTFTRKSGSIVAHLDARPFDTLHRPSVDVMFESAAQVYGERVLGIVMTGMGSDGKQGAAWIKSRGGKVYTEAEETCVVYGMPRSVVEAGLSDRSIPLNQMVKAILDAL